MTSHATVKNYMSWRTYEEYVALLVAKLQDAQYKHKEHKIERLVGIPRGGLVLATMLSHRTGLPLSVFETPPVFYNPGILLVDDIVDSGDTMREWDRGYGHPFVSLLWREGCPKKPWLYAGTVELGTHIVFPYETDESTY